MGDKKIRWGVLKSTDQVEGRDLEGKKIMMNMMEVLCQKHPEPLIPNRAALLVCDNLP